MSVQMKHGTARTMALALAGCMIMIGGTAARADYPQYVKSACKKDFKTFCPSYSIGSTALRQCIRSVVGQLSPRCIEALKRSGEKRN